ncbi:hypothetical protein ONZ45_g4560 [Pleurotus djamor]|nr:hypothetical protein ONZ45_g4560 [Pleurotus djamor]
MSILEDSPIFHPPADVIDRIVKAVASSSHYQTEGTPIVNTSTSSFVTTIDLGGERRFVKCGADVAVYEALSMEFVRSSTSIPVPKLFAVFSHSDWTYIVMEYIKADTLDSAQFSMTPEQLFSVAHELKGFVSQLKTLSSKHATPLTALGAWPSGPYRNVYFQGIRPNQAFRTMREFYGYWLGRLTHGDQEELRLDSLATATYSPTLTHGDLSPRNILVQDGKVIAVLDWETFGWYPDFWEYMAALRSAWSLSWMNSLEQCFGKIPQTGGRFLSIVHSALSPSPQN